MDNLNNALQILSGAWPTIQPAISTVFSMLIASLFIRGNTNKSEIEKIKNAKFSEIADTLLSDGHITHLEYYKCRNFNKIAQKADKIYSQQQINTKADPVGVENSQLNIDWFIRFFEDAGNISDDGMQVLWSKVLAGEIKQPGSFSLRTLDVLKSLSKTEAEAIQLICSFAIKVDTSYFLMLDKEMVDRYNYADKMHTVFDCNIVENSVATRFNFKTEQPQLLMRTKSLLCHSSCQDAQEYYFTMLRFTFIGNEMVSLIQPDKDYFIDFCKLFKQRFTGLELTVHTITNEEADEISYNPVSLI